jgi:chloramphenicol-sensitive protein RarD
MFPLYFPVLEPAGAVEILAHRMIWSLLVSAVILTAVRGWRALFAMRAKVWGLVVAAAALISVNWVIYIWAVNNGHVVEAALGYFINPLVSVLLGVLLFRERLRAAQWTAVGLGGAAVLILTLAGGTVPWVSLALALSFGCYGLVKKVIPLRPTASLTAEGLVQFLPAVGYLAFITAAGTSTFTAAGAGHAVLLMSSGLVTCLPLLAFAAAAQALPLSVLGLLQYLTPVIQFLLGVLWFGEPMPTYRWVGFVLVWCALAVFTADAMQAANRGRRTASSTPAGPRTPDRVADDRRTG